MPNLRFNLWPLTLAAVLLTVACTPPQTETAPDDQQAETTEDSQAAPPEASVDSTTSPSPPTDSTASEPVPAEATAARSGDFTSGEHATQGGATLVNQNGAYTLTFDDGFSTANGPDLVVVLHRSAAVLAETTPPAYPLTEGDYVVVAPLAATNGTQQYTVSGDIDVDEYQSIAIWCQEFNATFGAATLN